MTTITAKGTSKDKASGNTLRVNNVSMNEDAALVVCVAYDNAEGPPTSVTWGNRPLKRRVNRDPGTPDIGMSVWTAASINRTKTEDVVCTWSGNILERVMVVTSLEGVNKINEKKGADETVDTADPATGLTDHMDSVSDLALAYFAMEGPAANDTVGTLEIRDAASFATATTGQRDGTAGAPPISNVGIQEFYLDLTSCIATNARITGATSRKWCCAIVTMTPMMQYVRYYSRAKCTGCGQPLWTTDNGASVTCACSDSILHPDGTGTNIEAVTDEEMLAEALIEYGGPEFDTVVLVEM